MMGKFGSAYIKELNSTIEKELQEKKAVAKYLNDFKSLELDRDKVYKSLAVCWLVIIVQTLVILYLIL